MSLIHLVRHGQASAGTDNYDRLSDIGREQSRLLGQWWLSQGFSPRTAFHGSLERQRDTASLSLQVLRNNAHIATPIEHEGLNEYNHRVIESHFTPEDANYAPEAMSFEDYFNILSRWRDNKPSTQSEQSDSDVESWQDFKARGWYTVQALGCLDDKDSEAVFFTSGGVIATILANVLDLDFEHTIDAIWRIRNTSVSTFQMSKGKARLVDFNCIAHLQEQRQAHLITLI